MAGSERRPTGRELVLAAAVGVVLADSSIVTLALPEVLRRFDATVLGVSWVLTAFNLVLALAVLPAARLVRHVGGRRLWVAGIPLFAAASLACALAPSIGVLIAGRCFQALGGAATLAGAIDLLAASRGSHRAGAGVWGPAGMAGLAVGPALGGLLTELLSWQSIFALQVPLALLAPLAPRPGVPGRRLRPSRLGLRWLAPEAALALLSAGLTGALFLIVVMLIEGWRKSPLEAALVVSVMPAATLAARAAGRRLASSAAVTAAGALAMAAGLAALGLLPDAGIAWTLAPQVVIGVGIALTLPGLTERALAGPDPGGTRAAGTIAARHLGIVAGIVLLTPVFNADLEEQERAAQRSGTALLLDANLPPSTKIDLGVAIGERIERARGRLPALRPAFRHVDPPPESRGAFERLRERIQGEVERAATQAFSRAFLGAGVLALLALVPIALAGGTAGRQGNGEAPGAAGGRARLRGGLAALGVATVAAAVLIASYLAAGGGRYKPLPVADPCKPRPVEELRQRDDLGERLVLSALDGAACRLRVTREELALAVADPKARARFARAHRLSEEQVEEAVRAGLRRAVVDARRTGALSELEAGLVRRAVDALPVGLVLDVLRRSGAGDLLELLRELARRG